MVEVLYPTRISTHGGSIDGSKFIPTQKHTKWCVLDSEISILHASSPTHFVDHWRIILHISLQQSVAADEDKRWCLCADAGIPTYMLECFSIASNICMACFIHVFSVLSGEYWWKYEKKNWLSIQQFISHGDHCNTSPVIGMVSKLSPADIG